MKEKLKTKLRPVAVGVLTVGVVAVFFYFVGPHLWVAVKVATHSITKIGMPSFLKPFEEALKSAQAKVDELRRAEIENDQLKKENAFLKVQLESVRFDCRETSAITKTNEISQKLSDETGSLVGRTLASIKYRAPTHLLPPQLYTLAMTYFKAREDEKAAVIFSLLIHLQDNDAYKTSRNFLMTGISWYRLDHFELADSYFERVLQEKDLPENLPWQAQARLWRAVVAHKTHKTIKSQFWLLDLVDHHPYSKEAGWINAQKEVNRAPADRTHSQSHH